jgi:hypothetical protein
VGVVACSDERVIYAGQCGQQHPQGAFGEWRIASRLDTPCILTSTVRGHKAGHVLTKELSEVESHTIRGIVPGILISEKEPCPGQHHIQIGIRGPARVSLLLKTIPLTQEKDRLTSRIDNQQGIGTSWRRR